MQLLREFIDYDQLEIITESVQDGENKKKVYKIKGPFLVAESKNKNSRKYRRPLIEREVAKMNKTKIKNHNAFGELDHPKSPIVSLQNMSHIIESLDMDGDIAIGCARLIDEGMGKIAQSIIDAGGKLMVSSRGLGTIDKASGYVNDSFNYLTQDLVSDGSFNECMVDAILEQKEWIMDGEGNVMEQAINHLQESVDKNAKAELLTRYMIDFINEIKGRL